MVGQTAETIKDSTSVQKRYVEKYFEGSSHTWAIRTLDKLGNIGNALDVGPGTGLLGMELKQRGVDEIYGVEIDAETRVQLRKTYVQVEECISSFRDKKFSLILCMDVLEHMADPFAFIQEAASLLKPGGHLMVSLPNVAHWSVRLPLLFGQFNYQQRGIMDRTHLQFFTRKRACELIKSVKTLQIQEVRSSIEPVELLLPEWAYSNTVFQSLSRLRTGFAQVLPGLMAYQHLILAASKPDSV